jgi:hypothetical protein
MRWAGHVACMEREERYIQVLVGKAEEKRPLEDPYFILHKQGSDVVMT